MYVYVYLFSFLIGFRSRSWLRVVSVPRLPRDALVEWQVLAVRKDEAWNSYPPDCEDDDEDVGESDERVQGSYCFIRKRTQLGNFRLGINVLSFLLPFPFSLNSNPVVYP